MHAGRLLILLLLDSVYAGSRLRAWQVHVPTTERAAFSVQGTPLLGAIAWAQGTVASR